MFKIGIECESIEGKNPMWGVGKMLFNLLKELSNRPELQNKYRITLYFKDNVPDFQFLKSPIFEIKKVPVLFFKNRLFPIYYFALLPIKLWFNRPDMMFWPNYMLPIIAPRKSIVMLTEDVYYEAHDKPFDNAQGKLPFQYRLAYRIFCWWAAKYATKIMAISETSKKSLVKLYKIKPERIFVNYLGVDFLLKDQGLKSKALGLRPSAFSYILFIGQMFPRRHAKETILAFEKFITDNTNSQILQSSFDRLKHGQETTPRKNLGISDLDLILVGPDKYPGPTIEPLIKEVNNKLDREAVTHKDYVRDNELAKLYANAKALIYVSDREAFGLPPMEALSFGVPPVIMDNELGHELFEKYAFYSKSGNPDDIAEMIKQALTDIDKIPKIKNSGPEFVKKYNWKSFMDRFLKIIKAILTDGSNDKM